MGRVVRSAALAAALFVTLSCAATGGRDGAALPGVVPREIAVLDRAIAKERDAAVLPGLLFERGHAYLVKAESVRGPRGAGAGAGRHPIEFHRLLIGALRDFDDIAMNFPRSAEAPEALFHLGVSYDHPNLSDFGIALGYYRRTVEKYPGTESARKAGIAIENIEAFMRAVGEGRHGAP